MFSANENIALRQYKKRVVDYVESCLPEEALDLGWRTLAECFDAEEVGIKSSVLEQYWPAVTA